MDRLALILVIIGALVWGVVGIFGMNPIAWMANGSMSVWSRIAYTIIGLGGLWCIKLLFRKRELVRHNAS